jgi:hypothetical protein
LEIGEILPNCSSVKVELEPESWLRQGLDAHCRNSFFAVMDERGRVVQKHKVETNEAGLLNFIRSVPGRKALAFEETTISQWLYVLLKDQVEELIVCDPAANVTKVGAKTDFIDAIELADLLRVGRLSPVFHTADERMELRTLVSGYDDLATEWCTERNGPTARRS